MTEIGPHILQYDAPWGAKGVIKVTIHLDGDLRVSLGGNDFIDERTGRAVISCEWFAKEIKLQAENDIQLIMWLISTSDIYTKKICEDNKVKIYRIEPGDVEATSSIYKP